jgi:hypothetical protein
MQTLSSKLNAVCLFMLLTASVAVADDWFNMSKPGSTPTTKPQITPAISPTPAAPQITPAAPTTIPSLLAVPSAGAQTKAAKLVEEVYEGDIVAANTTQAKAALARKMLQAATDEQSDMNGKFVLFTKARDMYSSAGDLAGSARAIDEMAQVYQVDPLQMKADASAATVKFLHDSDQRRDFVPIVESISDQAVTADRYDLAKQLDEIALTAARAADDPVLLQTTSTHIQRVSEIQRAYELMKPAELALKQKPNDPQASLKVGRFECFIKGNWDCGLPMLAMGSDTNLARLAQAELKHDSDPTTMAKVADGWWEAADTETGTAKMEIRSHAVSCYGIALPSLSGLAKAKAEARIKEVGTASASGTDSKWIDVLANKSAFSLHGQTFVTPEGIALGPEDDSKVETVQNVAVPFRAEFEVKTDSTNIRLNYNRKQIIFNWEVNRTELRFQSFATGAIHAIRGKGEVPVNVWLKINLVVNNDDAEVFVNGELRGRVLDDFRNLQSPLSVFCSHGSIVTVKEFRVSK